MEEKIITDDRLDISGLRSDDTKKVEKKELESLVVDRKESMTDVIGLDVLRLNTEVNTPEEAAAAIKEYANETFDIVNSNGATFVIRTTVADLNKINGVIPEDLEQADAIAVQVKIAEVLQKAGLDVGINEEQKAELEEMAAQAKADYAEEVEADTCSA